MGKEFNYDVAISFAEEDRNAALALSLAFELQGIKNIYYYPDKKPDTVGEILEQKIKSIYSIEAKYAVVLVSDFYFDKKFTMLELDAIASRMQREESVVYAIPVILNDKVLIEEFPYLSDKDYLSWNFNPKYVAEIIFKKLGHTQIKEKEQSIIKNIFIKNQTNAKYINTVVNK